LSSTMNVLLHARQRADFPTASSGTFGYVLLQLGQTVVKLMVP